MVASDEEAAFDPSPPGVEAAKFITDAVGDVGRPRAALAPCRNLNHLPRDTHWAPGVANIVGYVRHGLSHVLRLRQEFGPVFRTAFGPSTIVWVSDADLFLEIARNEDGAWSTALAWLALLDGLDTSSPTLDMSVTLDFAPHKDVRKMMQPAFSPAAIASYTETASAMFEREIDSWIRRGRVDF